MQVVSLVEIDVGSMQIWIHVHGLSLDMFNIENAYWIGNNVGRCICVEPEEIMQQRTFLRMNVKAPLKAELWWTDSKGQDKWVTIKYDRLSNFCYRCGRLRHMFQSCVDEVIMSKIKLGYPLYGSWLAEARPRSINKSYHIEGEGS